MINQKGFLIAAITGSVLILVVALSPLLTAQIAAADKEINQKCDAANKFCKIITQYDLGKNSKITQNQYFNFSGLSSGSTVDQQARNDNANQSGFINRLVANESSDDKEFGIVLERLSLMATTINNLVDNNRTVFAALNNTIVDVNDGNAIPPVENNTGPIVTNETGPIIVPEVNDTGPITNSTPTDTNSTG